MTAVGNAPLYVLADLHEALDAELAENGGELTPELEARLATLTGAENVKLENIGLYIREQTAHAHAIKEEEDRLHARRIAKENAVEGLKRYAFLEMQRLGKTRVDGTLCTVAIQRNGQPSIECLDPGALHASGQGDLFVERVETIDYRLRRDAILAAWKAQQPLPAGVTVTLGSHLRVR